jgi:hypothetical protein
MSKKEKKLRFKTGVNLSDDRRFEAGDEVPNDISATEMKALEALDAIEEA